MSYDALVWSTPSLRGANWCTGDGKASRRRLDSLKRRLIAVLQKASVAILVKQMAPTIPIRIHAVLCCETSSTVWPPTRNRPRSSSKRRRYCPIWPSGAVPKRRRRSWVYGGACARAAIAAVVFGARCACTMAVKSFTCHPTCGVCGEPASGKRP